MKTHPAKPRLSFVVMAAAVAFTSMVVTPLGRGFLPAQTPGSQAGSGQTADRAYRTAMETADQQIADEVKAHSELMKNLEYLTTQIGPRLTGSPEMDAASQWTLARFQAYGISAHLEPSEIAHAWTRGADTAAIVSPIARSIGVRSMGWSQATDGEISAPVVFLPSGASSDDVENMKDKLQGAVVCMGPPVDLPYPYEPADSAYDAVIPPPRGVPAAGAANPFQNRQRLGQSLADAGAAAILRDSGKPDSLFNMGGAGGPAYQPSRVPSAFLTHEDYSLLYRLSQAGPVKIKLNLRGTFSSGPGHASITVAEIPGSTLSSERVIIGGHLDSWDLGQGALDNGTGAMAVLEAARTLKALGWKPKRTLTFILFTGEEEGGIGVRTYLHNHAAEVPKMDAVLIDDTGTGRVFSIALEDLYETATSFGRIYQPLQEVFDLKPATARYYGGSDHVAFLHAGVPAYFCVQEPARYREAHHSQTDTFDKVIPEGVNQGASLLAAWVWNVSEFSEAMPHHEAEAPAE